MKDSCKLKTKHCLIFYEFKINLLIMILNLNKEKKEMKFKTLLKKI